MSLITMTNQDQSPYQFRVKFNPGSLVIPRNGQIGLLHFKAERSQEFIVNSSNDTFILFQGLSQMVKLSNTGSHIDYLRPQIIKIPHGNYDFNDNRNHTATTGLSTNNGTESLIAPAIAKALNEASVFGNSLYLAQLVKAPEPGSETEQEVLVISAKRILKNINTNILVDYENFSNFNNNASTITKTDNNTALVYRPTNHSNVIISKNNMLMNANLNTANTSFLTEVTLNLADGGTETDDCVNSFIGFCNDWQLKEPYNINRSPVINELNEAVLGLGTKRPLGSNMPISLEINEDKNLICNIRSITEDENGNLGIGEIVATLSRTGVAQITDTTGGNPQQIRFHTVFHTDGKLKLRVTYVAPDGTSTDLTDNDLVGGNNYVYLSDLIPEFLNNRVRSIIHWRNTASDLSIRGKDRVVGILSGVEDQPMILANGTAGNLMCGIIHHEVEMNQILNLGGANGFLDANKVEVRVTGELNRLSKQCNFNIFNTDDPPATGNTIINKTGSGSFFSLVGRQSNTNADPNAGNNNGVAMSGVVNSGEQQTPEFKVQIKSLQGIHSIVGNNINGGVDKTIYMGTFYDGTLGEGNIVVVDKETPTMIDINNKEEIQLSNMEINITDMEGNLKTDLKDSTNICLLVKEKFNPITIEQRNKPLQRLDNQEEAFKDASKIN